MSAVENRNVVLVQESGHGPYGQFVSIGQHIMGADEPGAVGGHNTGPDPFEFVLAGIGACTVMTIRMYANRKKWPLDDVRVSVRHVRAATGGEGGVRHAVERTISLAGALDDEQRAALMAIAERCPVSLALETGMEITSIAG
ncbi:putative redox protein [Pseudochelatococcus lubricantis]|uniref:Redox protein n=1 Tax=Pseudochelatococcus lubricantis TaxID=1538102 RepID=A0ABX0UZ77_9HYPH|nr:OsmC family protein [Pseudochelatococcus lubricantis]NIJ58256.1 putative redox protein [Pseudochelatococcus lubricantis]